jgi:hypothetical protein
MQREMVKNGVEKNGVEKLYPLSALFEKKNKEILNKKLTHITSDTGKTRHYTPAAQE